MMKKNKNNQIPTIIVNDYIRLVPSRGKKRFELSDRMLFLILLIIVILEVIFTINLFIINRPL